jgi:hypothetical protein
MSKIHNNMKKSLDETQSMNKKSGDTKAYTFSDECDTDIS